MNSALVALIAVRIAQAIKLPERTALAGALLAGLIFGLHPVHVESVAWISERKDVLSAFFFLLSLLAYMRYALAPYRGLYAAALLLFALGLMSKPMVVSLPIVLLLLDLYPLERLGKGLKRAIIEKIPFFALSILSAAITLSTQQAAISTTADVSLQGRVMIALKAFIFYIGKLLVPAGLAPFYPHPGNVTVLSAEYVFTAIVFLAISLLCAYTFKKNKAFTAVWLYYVVTLTPVSGLVQAGAQAAADRYAYLPSVAPTILISFAAVHFAGRLNGRSIFPVAAAILISSSILAALTWRQLPVWKDSLSLWSYQISIIEEKGAAADNPINLLPYYNRGSAYFDAGDYEKSIEDFTKVLFLNPGYKDAYVNRGSAYGILGRYGLALNDFNKALAIDPTDVAARKNRAMALEVLKGAEPMGGL